MSHYRLRQIAGIAAVVGLVLFGVGIGALAPRFSGEDWQWFFALATGATLVLFGQYGRSEF